MGFQPKADLFPSIAAPANVADAGPAMYVDTCFRLRVDRTETEDTGNDDAGKTGVSLLLTLKNDEIEELNFEQVKVCRVLRRQPPPLPRRAGFFLVNFVWPYKMFIKCLESCNNEYFLYLW